MEQEQLQTDRGVDRYQDDALEVAKHLVDISQLLIDNVEQNDDFIVVDKNNADRTAIRVENEHIVFASRYKSLFHRNSQELVFGSCVEFARQNEDKFREFLTEYQAESFKRSLSETISEEAEIEDSNDSSSEDNDESEIEETTQVEESEPSLEPDYHEPQTSEDPYGDW